MNMENKLKQAVFVYMPNTITVNQYLYTKWNMCWTPQVIF